MKQDIKFEVNDIVSFRHKSRKVKGIVIRVDEKGLLINLMTDYIGKNEEWFAMEDKYFFIGNMSHISIKKQKLLNHSLTGGEMDIKQ